jgi:hypothetical protein
MVERYHRQHHVTPGALAANDVNMVCAGVARLAEAGRGRIDMLIDMASLLLRRDGLMPPATGM